MTHCLLILIPFSLLPFDLFKGHTMSMMYKIVADALRKEGLHESHPQEYLNFYCLGKREVSSDVSSMNTSNENSAMVTTFHSEYIYKFLKCDA